MTDILLIKNGEDQTFKKFIIGLLGPLQTLTDGLKTFETGELKRAKWNGQKIVLQAALNDIFGITSEPSIHIETNDDIAQNTYFYFPSELVPVYFSKKIEGDPVYLFKASEPPAEDYDFKVLVPAGIYTAELDRQIRAQTNLYKIVGPKFLIETY